MKTMNASKDKAAAAAPPEPNFATSKAYSSLWQFPWSSTAHSRMPVSKKDFPGAFTGVSLECAGSTASKNTIRNNKPAA